MKKMIIKLTAASLSLILAVTVAVMSSYAWLTISESPAANGIHIAISGGSTIQIAPDLVKELDGATIHYPGAFDDTLNFSQHESYAYLQELGGLTPVSTVDGVNWLLPTYYQKDDPEVINGTALNGELKPAGEFILDSTLSFANLTNTQMDLVDQGSYIYLDFWVVSPAADYRLRISTGDDSSGSFVMGLMEPQETDTDGDGIVDAYQLVNTSDAAAASARVGFLVNQDMTNDAELLAYLSSEGYSDQFRQLKGVYPEKGDTTSYGYHQFMIYEPNGTLHPDSTLAENGSYVITQPLDYNGGVVTPSNVTNLTVQDTSTWLASEYGNETLIEQVFQGSIAASRFRSSSTLELKEEFYNSYLQGQIAAYVDKGSFFKRTDNLNVLARSGNATASYVQAERDNEDSTVLVGATDDAYIVDLERNVPQRIRMFVWLEGQDVDCTNDVKESGIAISIEFAGSNNGV